jgi:hypothetical protein
MGRLKGVIVRVWWLADDLGWQLAGPEVATPCPTSIKAAILCNEVASGPTC